MRKILLVPLALLLCLFAKAQTPVTYYPFTGNDHDAVGPLNGTASGTVLTTDRFGNANSAYSFDRATQWIAELLQQQTVTAQTMTMDMSKHAKGIYL
jgi:hypothetical protein